MFYAICAALCLAVMFLAFAGLVILSIPALRVLDMVARAVKPKTTANLLFIIRLLPLAIAVMVSAGLALPAFLEFEPHSTREMLDWPLLLLAGLGLGAALTITVRLGQMLYTTRSLRRQWSSAGSQLPVTITDVPVYCVDGELSLLAVTGIFRPRIFVSRDVARALTTDELAAALRHELAHVGASDNLKQLLLKISRPPRWLPSFGRADLAWTNASEIAADENALARGVSALELSSALIKVGRLSIGRVTPAPLAASHLVPCECGSATMARAAHLRQLLENGAPEEGIGGPLRAHRLAIAGAAMLAVYLAALGTLLPAIHNLLEFLVR